MVHWLLADAKGRRVGGTYATRSAIVALQDAKVGARLLAEHQAARIGTVFRIAACAANPSSVGRRVGSVKVDKHRSIVGVENGQIRGDNEIRLRGPGPKRDQVLRERRQICRRRRARGVADETLLGPDRIRSVRHVTQGDAG